ncbi:aromatic ring-hydroxylating oxygenase subunit alpha [Brevibacillus sp. NRS-1366]|uniref:aromatic ring-hydroxylating oxygenase subunit alpha n=1 Tax=Brevibacillus sp. NRS-1366 TaxID=3233899 RepID=UPI003D22EC62
MKTHFDINQYIREGAINGRIYTEPDVFTLEMNKIFEKTWVYVAHESEVANQGDYKTTVIGQHPVIVSRGADDGEYYVMFNRCRHRAASVCQDEKGNANFFRCQYHGWTYTNSGDLVGAPFQDGYGEEFDRCKMGLIRVPRIASYRGFIFASLSEDGPSLEEHLGLARPYLDMIADQGIELTAGAQKYAYHANWKFQVENTIDPYHLSFVHKTFFDIQDKKKGVKTNFARMHKQEKVSDLGNGHSLYELADDLGIGALPFNLIIFPNLSFVGSQVRVIKPVSVDYTEVALYPMMLKDATLEENAARLRKHEGFYGPASFGTPDDLEVAFDRVREGLRSGGEEWLIISRGMNREEVNENGVLSGNSSDEVSVRAIYKKWRELVTI